MKPFIKIYISLMMMLMFAVSCKKSDGPTPAQVSDQSPAAAKGEVLIEHNKFSPEVLTVPVNSMVTWVNRDNMNERVESTTGLFNSGDISPYGTFSYRFTKAGSYSYYCGLHVHMTGKIIVQ
jgi:plastocyanin